jgi:hypothetical protein
MEEQRGATTSPDGSDKLDQRERCDPTDRNSATTWQHNSACHFFDAGVTTGIGLRDPQRRSAARADASACADKPQAAARVIA